MLLFFFCRNIISRKSTFETMQCSGWTSEAGAQYSDQPNGWKAEKLQEEWQYAYVSVLT